MVKSLECEIDKDIKFYEKYHIYEYKGEKVKNSVTQFISKFFEKFDSEKVVEGILSRPNYLRGKYKDLTKQEILDMWEYKRNNSCEEGTKVHKSVEDFILTGKKYDGQAFLNAHNYIQEQLKNGFILCEPEKILYLKEKDLAGQCDCVLYHKEKDYFKLVDWKNCEQIKKKGFKGKKALKPIENLEDCNFVKYSLQLNIYKYIANSENYKEAFQGKVKEMEIVNIHKNLDSYKTYKVNNMNIELLFKY